ncbi:MAG TPA: tetratricopeptide repeat protein, partial [Polyangiaceae bacterium]|nr:tetratricopeptide repeat protein [Polyangiaceae bacterium]
DDAIAVLRPLAEDILYQTPENAWGNLGWAYLEKGDFDKAIEALRRSIAAQPDFCVGNYRLGLAYERKQSPAAAAEAYTRAVETDQPSCKGLQDAFDGRARVLLRLGRAEDARNDLERCVQLDKRTAAGRECTALLAKLK